MLADPAAVLERHCLVRGSCHHCYPFYEGTEGTPAGLPHQALVVLDIFHLLLKQITPDLEPVVDGIDFRLEVWGLQEGLRKDTSLMVECSFVIRRGDCGHNHNTWQATRGN
jgi:hypothetical protein